MMPEQAPILQPGRTCWRTEQSNRLALIVDACDYFAVAKAAIEQARHSIYMIGWDFDLRLRLDPANPDATEPDELGAFLKHTVNSRPGLQAYILKWDMAMLFTLSRQIVPVLALDLMTQRRIHFRLDAQHPSGAAHHQKIIVIDDALAFCGGIDMTDSRWDTRDHKPDDEFRVLPGGSPYPPFHDVTTAVDGEAAKALGELARERWHRATGSHLPTPPACELDPWPERLKVTLRNVPVSIARTWPQLGKYEEVREIERLYLTAILAAKWTIYMESQYLASHAIRDALIKRLREPDGPEVVVINPESADGWLEQSVMDTARALMVRQLRREDRHDRFRIYYPVNASGTPIYVHAKVLTIDDRLLRVGSSNLNNRSMGFDTECDLAIEAVPGEPSATGIADTVIGFRNDLIAEHLGVGIAAVEQALEASGSLVAAIDGLRRTTGRTLVPLEVEELNEVQEQMVEARLLDPERPKQVERAISHGIKKFVTKPNWAAIGAAAAGIGLAAFAGRRLYTKKYSIKRGKDDGGA
jgi:phosphatidylserine/phosphatidylglycerophosphate/cardiolipin synthase-like enzyme